MNDEDLAALLIGNVFGGVSDTTAPTCTITCAQSSPSTATTLNFTITFSEVVTGFEVGDFVITNGAKGALGGSGAVYTCDVVPTGMSVVTANVAANVAIDGAGNNNTVATEVSITSTAPFSDAFTRANGAIGSIWTGATATISSNAALITPTLGSELLADPGVENWASTTDLTSWTEFTAGTSTINQESTVVHGGSNAARMDIDNIFSACRISQNITLALAAWMDMNAWARTSSGEGAGRLIVNFVNQKSILPNTSYAQHRVTLRNPAANPMVGFYADTPNNQSVYYDDCSVKQITLTSMYATLPNVSVNAVTAQVLVTVDPAGTQAGHILNLDSLSSPANFVIAYLDGTNAVLDKCVAGTYSNVISGAVTFGATKNLKVVKSGNNYSLYYGATGSEAQVGVTTEVTGMTGNLHGLFSTHSTAKFDTYQLAATP